MSTSILSLHVQQGELHAKMVDSLENQGLVIDGQERMMQNQRLIGDDLSRRVGKIIGDVQNSLGNQKQLLAKQAEAHIAVGRIQDTTSTVETIVKGTTESLMSLREEQQRAMSVTTDSIRQLASESKLASDNINLLLSTIGQKLEQLLAMDFAILSEIFTLHSILFYMAALIVGVVLTGSKRSAGARFGVISMICLNMVMERVLTGYLVEPGSFLSVVRPLRKVTTLVCLVIVLTATLTYTDLRIANHALLTDLHNQLNSMKEYQRRQEAASQRQAISYLGCLERAVSIHVPQFGKQQRTRLRRKIPFY